MTDFQKGYMKRIEQIIALGRKRLKLAQCGKDFFQSVPDVKADADLMTWYRSQFGHVINSDCAKLAFLKDGYEPTDPKSVAKFYKPASTIVQMLVSEMLFEIDAKSIVVFMAGGNGAGKSTFCDGARLGLSDRDWIIDATLASYEAAAETMRAIIEKGAKTVLVFVDRKKEFAWSDGVLKRSAHGSHQTPRAVFDATHANVPKNVMRFRTEFSTAISHYEHIENW